MSNYFYHETGVVYWPPTRPDMPFQRRGSAYSIGVGELGWQYGTGLKSHGTVTDWCTGRVWPVNCMTDISAWWRSNMPFQDIEWALSYYITGCTGNSIGFRQDAVEKNSTQRKTVPGQGVWRPDQFLETRCGRESQHPAESWAPGLRLSNPWERERHNADGHKSEGQCVAVLFGLQLPLTHKPFK